jgi:hypothetical protein
MSSNGQENMWIIRRALKKNEIWPCLYYRLSHFYKEFTSVQTESIRVQETRFYLKNAVFWNVTPYGSCKNIYFRGT